MRTTIRIDDDLMPLLRGRAAKTGGSITKAFNELLRRGLAAEASDLQQKRERFVQQTYDMGKPLVDLTKALALSYAEDDEKLIAMMQGDANEPRDRSPAGE
ncbi:MAG: hypothetical protein AAF790_07905 [Planctomycetota bacterium]